MSEGPRGTTRFEPREAWTTVTDAPVQGLSLARETGILLAWDEGRNVYLIDEQGDRRMAERAPAPIVSAAISDDGSLVALLVGGPRLLLLDGSLSPEADRPASGGASSLAVDSHGRYVAVSSKYESVQFYTRLGKTAGKLSVKQPLPLLRFVSGQPMLLGAGGFGALMAVELGASGKGDALAADVVWEERLLSNVGRLEATGDGSMILASCFNLGIQRYDLQGHNEGSYHLGGTATHAVPDFTGRSIAASTHEGELFILNSAGNIRWKTQLAQPASALEIDALGRYLIYALPTGEIRRIDLQRSAARTAPAPSRGRKPAAGAKPAKPRPSGAAAGSVRKPDWTASVALSSEEAESAVVAVLDDPPRVAYMTRSNRLQIITQEGKPLGQAPEIIGVGRFLRTCPGWVAAATDRMIVLYDARRNGVSKLELNMYQITHLAIRPDSYGLAIVQERDRLGRATVAGRWVWKRELRSGIEDIALGPLGLLAVSTEDGVLSISDAAGEPAGRFEPDSPEPLLVQEAPAGSGVEGLTWISLARRAQVLRGHSADGRVLWESPTPWEAWQMQVVGRFVVLVAPDGRALSYDASGYLRSQAGAEEGPSVFVPADDGQPVRLVRRGTNLLCSRLNGEIVWRALSETPVGALGAASSGTAVFLGRDLAFFSTLRGTPAVEIPS